MTLELLHNAHHTHAAHDTLMQTSRRMFSKRNVAYGLVEWVVREDME